MFLCESYFMTVNVSLKQFSQNFRKSEGEILLFPHKKRDREFYLTTSF